MTTATLLCGYQISPVKVPVLEKQGLCWAGRQESSTEWMLCYAIRFLNAVLCWP